MNKDELLFVFFFSFPSVLCSPFKLNKYSSSALKSKLALVLFNILYLRDFEDFIDASFARPFQLKNLGIEMDEDSPILVRIEAWDTKIDELISFLPYADSIYSSFKEMKASGDLSDHYYHNYRSY